MNFKNLNPENTFKENLQNKSVDEAELKCFANALKDLVNNIESAIKSGGTEEHLKTNLRDFLNNLFYSNYYVNTKSYIGNHQADLAIHSSDSQNSPVNVIFEIKRPNNTEMLTLNDCNSKALHETITYYLWEKVVCNNIEMKHIVVTDIYNWFIFDASDFHSIFYGNKQLVNTFEQWKSGATDAKSTASFYQHLKNLIDEDKSSLPVAFFKLPIQEDLFSDTDYFKSDIIDFYKILSPEHLLKVSMMTAASYSLNRDFYYELLYIIGLKEKEENGKILIQRMPSPERMEGSLLENTIEILSAEVDLEKLRSLYNEEKSDDAIYFETALELCLIWINRILFIKLLESQLYSIHNKNESYKFLTKVNIDEFDHLNILFHHVLNYKEEERRQRHKVKFPNLPYLNSSLFEESELEKATSVKVSNLENHLKIPVFSRTVLTDEAGKSLKGKEVETLPYLLDFLNAFHFGSESIQGVMTRTERLINSAVLGLLFEKINGYKDGSFFTPANITMYMASTSIKLALVNKFNETKGWNLMCYTDLVNKIDSINIKEANEIVNSIRICDPAVGSGHFLVSCLNELIFCKFDLGILVDEGGSKIKKKDYIISIERDELTVKYSDGKDFKYIVNEDGIPNPEIQRIQKTLFFEKQIIIENCLFGVDINPKSVLICRLRLWIELLKSAYYTQESNFTKMETLPNIDINIKLGDSLLSKFPFEKDSGFTLKDTQFIQLYKRAVQKYKRITDKRQKQDIKNEIENYKLNMKGLIIEKSVKSFTLIKLITEYNEKFESERALDVELTKAQKQAQDKEQRKLKEQIEQLEKEIKTLNNNSFYKNAFEWRFEFPELLDDDGNFHGFDLVIGNPPYVQLQKEGGKLAQLYENQNYKTFARTGDIYALFYEKGIQLLKPEGLLCFITSNKWMRAGYGEKLRAFFTQYNPIQLVDLGPGVFENATVDTNILLLQKATNQHQLKAVTLQKEDKENISKTLQEKGVVLSKLTQDAWFIGSNAEQQLKEKIERIGKPLKEWDVNIYRGVLTGLNEAFIITTEQRNEILAHCQSEAERQRTEVIIKPILRGRDIKRYHYQWAGLWVIGTFPALRLNIDDYPALKKYFIDHFDIRQLEQTGKKYPELGFNARKKTGNKWFETQDQIAYYPEFEKEKVVWQRITQEPTFCLVEPNVFILDSMAFFTGNNLKFVMAILNSKVIYEYVNMIVHQYGFTGFRLSNQYVEIMPLPPITSGNEGLVKRIEEFVDKILAAKNANPQADTQAFEKEIDNLVYSLYELNEEEIRIIEGGNAL